MQTIKELLLKYFSGEPLTESEQALLNKWAAASPDNQALIDNLEDDNWLIEGLARQDKIDMERIWAPISDHVKVREMPSERVYHLWSRYSVAAIILILIGLAGKLYFTSKKQPVSAPVIVSAGKPDTAKMIHPSAMLTLADGSAISLVQAHKGLLANQGNTKVTKSDGGQIIYNSPEQTQTWSNLGEKLSGGIGVPVMGLYNSVNISHGMKYKIQLQDGTMVWLNNETILRYPVTFNGREQRMVNLEKGEAYFEVAKRYDKSTGKKIPFIVSVRDMAVEVKGTHFNISAYEDEMSVRTTLLEGSVIVKKGGRAYELKPGQQAVVKNGKDEINVLAGLDTTSVIAWKNGLFHFKDADIYTAMKELSRWYNKQVIFQKGFDMRITLGNGYIYKNQELKDVLKNLERDNLNFSINGNTILVTR